MMKLFLIDTVLVAFTLLQVSLPVKAQRQIASRRGRPYEEKYSPQSGRCNLKEEIAVEDKDHAFKAASDKERPIESTRDNFPSSVDERSGISPDYKSKPIGDRPGYDPKPDRTGGGYVAKPTNESSDIDYKPELTRDGLPSSGSGSPGISSEYKPKTVDDRQGYDLKPDRTGGGHVAKPADDPVDMGHKPDYIQPDDNDYKKPTVDRDDLYRHGGGRYNPRQTIVRIPVRGDYDPEPPVVGVLVREGSVKGEYDSETIREVTVGVGNDPKPVADGPVRGDVGGYNPRPPVDTDEYNPKPVRSVVSGYNTKPGFDGDEFDHKTIASGVSNSQPVDERQDKRDYGGYFSGPVDVDSRPDQTSSNSRPVVVGGEGYTKDDDFRGDYFPERKHEAVVKRCVTGVCVPYYLCQDSRIITDGAGAIDHRRFRRQTPKDFEALERSLDGKSQPPSCGEYHVCCDTPETSTLKPYTHSCGKRNPSGINSRLLAPSNEGEAGFGEWPWQAAILKAEGKVNIFLCGGVLIDKYHVLTVAHCVFHLDNEYPLKVRLGEWDTQTTSEFLAHQDYRVSKIIVHPDFKNSSLWNDIALLRLVDQVLFAPHIASVCLPQYDEIFSGQNCVVTGWGKDAYKGGTFSNVKKEVALQVIDDYNCEEMLRKTRLGRFFQLHEGFLCAGGDYGLDSCKGDGGGPLVCFRKDKTFALAGLVSWGIDCGQPGVPGVYIKVQKYLNWVSKNTGVSLQEYSTVLSM